MIAARSPSSWILAPDSFCGSPQKRTAKRVSFGRSHISRALGQDERPTGFPALHLAPGHLNSDLDVALLETPILLSRANAKRVSRLGEQ